MKRPNISFDKDAIVDFLVRHGEKILAAFFALFACSLAWGGISAARLRPPGKDKQPPAIMQQADLAAQNIETAKHPPVDALKKAELPALIEPWRAPELADPPAVALWNRPLFDEKAKRTKPAILPIDDLRAVAGIAVLPLKNDPAAMPGRNAADLDAPPNASEPPRKPKQRAGLGRGNQRDADPNAAPLPPAAPQPIAGPKVRLVPYCIVTGLIPLMKQSAEYRQRFETAGLRDPKRDVPLWSDYLVERTVVSPDGREDWKRIDVKAATRQAQKEWTGIQAEQVPPEFLLAAERNPGAAAGSGYCAALPQLAGEPWGPEAVHPWVVQQLKKIKSEREAAAKAAAEGTDTTDAGNQSVPPDFQPAGGVPAPPGPGPVPVAVEAEGPEYRLFRFVDTAVEIGKTYRYRVRLSVWNPNYNLPAQHLSDAALAKEAKLPSPPSNATVAVQVPDTKTMLVRVLRKADTKRFKQGTVEVLVLGENPQDGNYSLRSLLTETGGLANVDSRLNRPGDLRTRGEDIVTENVLVDVRGKQEDRIDGRTNKPTPPPEPFEMLFLHDDGTFEIASAADSQLLVGRHAATLPAAEEPKAGRGDRPEPPQGGPANPFGNPFRP